MNSALHYYFLYLISRARRLFLIILKRTEIKVMSSKSSDIDE